MYQLGLGPQCVLCSRRQRTIANEGMLTEKMVFPSEELPNWLSNSSGQPPNICLQVTLYRVRAGYIYIFRGRKKKHVLTVKEKRPGLREIKEGR